MDLFFLHLDRWSVWAALNQPIPPKPPPGEPGGMGSAPDEAAAKAAARKRTLMDTLATSCLVFLQHNSKLCRPLKSGYTMKLTIVVDNSLNDLSAAMQASTFARIPAIVKAKLQAGGVATISADFVKAYALTLVSDDMRSADTLYVSPGVKAEFYPDRAELHL